MGLFQKPKKKTGPVGEIENLLEENPTHPFSQVHGSQKLRFRVRYKRFYYFLLLSLVSICVTATLMASEMYDDAFFLLSLAAAFSFSLLTILYKDARSYTLDPQIKMYDFHIGPHLRQQGQYHNIYIRMVRRIDMATASARYYLILHGYKVEAQLLSRGTTNKLNMRKLGQHIAERLDLNFFDVADRSSHHVIRHMKSRSRNKNFPLSQIRVPISSDLSLGGNDEGGDVGGEQAPQAMAEKKSVVRIETEPQVVGEEPMPAKPARISTLQADSPRRLRFSM